jgi:hypothetical protein
LSLVIATCGNDSSDDPLPLDAPVESSTTSTGVPSCSDVQNTVVFGLFGMATAGDEDEEARWANDPEDQPVARPGAAEVATAYRNLGYEILYVSLAPASRQIGDQPLVDAATVWLGVHGFPIADRTSVWAWDGEGEFSVALIEQMTRLSAGGVQFDAAYAGAPEMVFPVVAGGVPRDRMFTVGAAAAEGYVPVPEDLDGHLPEVEALDPVCER